MVIIDSVAELSECYNPWRGYWSLPQLSDYLARRVPGMAWAGYGDAPED